MKKYELQRKKFGMETKKEDKTWQQTNIPDEGGPIARLHQRQGGKKKDGFRRFLRGGRRPSQKGGKNRNGADALQGWWDTKTRQRVGGVKGGLGEWVSETAPWGNNHEDGDDHVCYESGEVEGYYARS